MTKIKLKKLDDQIEASFKIHFDRVQIPIWDIPKIYKGAREVFQAGKPIDDYLKTLAETYKAVMK